MYIVLTEKESQKRFIFKIGDIHYFKRCGDVTNLHKHGDNFSHLVEELENEIEEKIVAACKVGK